MQELDEELMRATEYALTDRDIELAQLLIGLDEASPLREHNTTATSDAVRNFALGLGDDNPLYTDEDYGCRTRWGGQVAPNIMAAVLNAPLMGDRLPDEIRRSTKGLFRGVHVFVSGGSWQWYRPIHVGDRLFKFTAEESLDVKSSNFGGRSVIRVRREVKFNQRNEVVGVYRVLRVLTERKTSRERGKNVAIEPAHYSEESLAAIDAIYEQEQRRGALPRYWEDVGEGEVLPAMVKGPLTVTEIIAFHAGGYGFVPYGLRSSRLGFKNRRRIPAFYVKNEHGVPDVAQRLHWDSSWAKAIGNPMAYDYGVMRETWFHHYATDWAGDDAFIVKQDDSIRRFNFVGDVQFLSGTVVAKRQENGMFLVDIDMRMRSQRDEETAYAMVTVSLPSRHQGAARLPSAPDDLVERTQRIAERDRLLRLGMAGGAVE